MINDAINNPIELADAPHLTAGAPLLASSATATTATTTPGTCETRVLLALRRINHEMMTFSHRLHHRFGLTMPQLTCLRAIQDADGLTAAALSRQIFVSASTLVGIIDRLQEKGMVRRERSPVDRRQINLFITEKGRDVVGHAPPTFQERLVEGLSGLSAEARATIAASLELTADVLGCSPHGVGTPLIASPVPGL
jgi:DNA-binding MarR family transcriptional regulator